MAYARNTTQGDGSTTLFPIPFDYIDRDHVKTFVGNVETTDLASLYTATFSSDTEMLVTAVADGAAVPDGVSVTLIRQTPVDQQLVTFRDGAVIRAQALNATTKQVLNVAEEIHDRDAGRMGKDDAGSFDADDARIVRVGDPVDAGDAVNMGYVDGLTAAINATAGQVSTDANTASTSARSANEVLREVSVQAATMNQLFSSFSSRYLGEATTDPVTGANGAELEEGQLYFNATTDRLRVFTGDHWREAVTAPQARIREFYFTATEGQTVFSGADRNNKTLAFLDHNLQVTINGIRMSDRDFEPTGGNTVTLNVATSVGDLVHVTVFESFQVADAVSASSGGTFAASVAFQGGLSLGHGWRMAGSPTGVRLTLNDDLMAEFDNEGYLNLLGAELKLNGVRTLIDRD